MMNRSYRFFRPGAFTLLLAALWCLLATPEPALSYSSGITGYSQSGCTCHSPGQSSATSLSFSSGSGSFNVSPGATLTLTLTVAHSSQSAAGTNIRVVNSSNQNAGSLSPASGSGLQLSGSELTHTSAKSMSGGQAEFTFTWTAPSTPGTYTVRAAGNAVNGNGGNNGDYYNTGTQTITVVSAPTVTVTSPNGGEEWCAGGTQNITWTAANIDNVRIELSSDGGGSYPVTLVASTPAAAGSWTWSIPAGQTLGNQYKIRVSDANNAATNDVGNGNFSIRGATAITTQPQSQTVCEGASVSFSVAAAGANLTYQWRKGGTNITGANQATYTIASPEEASAGSYDVVVTGSCGAAVTSNAATLTMRAKPRITQQPASSNGCAGASVTLSVVATGEGLTYQWRREGQAIAGANQASYTIPALAAADTGRYDVVVGGACTPNATSIFATVRIIPAPVISQLSPSQEVCEGAPVTLSVESNGAQEYIWKKNGTALPGTNQPTYTIPSMSANAAGEYTVTIVGVCESVTSDPIVLAIRPRPAITQQPVGLSVAEGAPIVLTVAASGSDLSYQWRKNGTALAGATQATLSIPTSQVNDAGTYTVVVSNGCGSVTSGNAVVTVTPVGPGPAILLSVSSIDFGPLAVGATTTVTVTVTNGGSQDLSLTALTLAGDNSGDFTLVTPPSLPVLLEPAGTVQLTLGFTPTVAGVRNAHLAFTSNAASNPQLTLTGTGAVPTVESTVGTTVDFGGVVVSEAGTQDIRVKNTGLIPVRITDISLGGAQPGQFSITSVMPTLPAELQPNEELSIMVRFAPSATGDAAASLAVAVEGAATLTLDLTGEGLPSTSVGETVLASSFAVAPNPVVDGTTVRVATVYAAGTVELAVVDAMGRTVRTLGRLEGTAEHTVWWDGRDNSGAACAAGLYRIVLSAGTAVQSIPVVIVR